MLFRRVVTHGREENLDSNIYQVKVMKTFLANVHFFATVMYSHN